jgi:hypothetical protein
VDSSHLHRTALLSQSARAARPRRAAQPVVVLPYLADTHARRARLTAHAAPCTALLRLGVQGTPNRLEARL